MPRKNFCQKRIFKKFFRFLSDSRKPELYACTEHRNILPCYLALFIHSFKEMLKKQKGTVVTKTLYSQFSIPIIGLVFLFLNCNKLASCFSINQPLASQKMATSMSLSLAIYFLNHKENINNGTLLCMYSSKMYQFTYLYITV